MKKVKIINFTEIFLDIGAIDKFFFSYVSADDLCLPVSQYSDIMPFLIGTLKSGICTAITVVARKGKLLDSDLTFPQNF